VIVGPYYAPHKRPPDSRTPILIAHQQREARKRLEAGETQRRVARSYNVSQSTIPTYLRPFHQI
jgi:DNA invertase Pin-like site-specific DNA recombinase